MMKPHFKVQAWVKPLRYWETNNQKVFDKKTSINPTLHGDHILLPPLICVSVFNNTEGWSFTMCEEIQKYQNSQCSVVLRINLMPHNWHMKYWHMTNILKVSSTTKVHNQQIRKSIIYR